MDSERQYKFQTISISLDCKYNVELGWKCGSLQKCIHTVLDEEKCNLLLLWLSFNKYHDSGEMANGKVIKNKEATMPRFKQDIFLLILIAKRVTENTHILREWIRTSLFHSNRKGTTV